MVDNRKYIWKDSEVIFRYEYPIIEKWIPVGSSVIDLGCGNGSLLRILKEKKKINELGIEISESGVAISKKHGLNVRQGSIDVNLSDIPDKAFDFAVCNVTIQMVVCPEITLKEMKRIAKYQIISFPNFAFILQRLELMFAGRLPKRLLYGYDWYNTGHLHQLSIKDFMRTASDFRMNVKDAAYLLGRHKMPITVMPNLLATEAILLLE